MQGYKDIGDLLCQARQERRVDISDVARALHIRPRYIEALEEGNIDAMPGLPYAKGYLMRYAGYLALDRAEIVRRFEMVAKEAQGSSFFMPHSFSHSKRVAPQTAVVATGMALFVLLLWAMWLRPGTSTQSLVEAFETPKPAEAQTAQLSDEQKKQVVCLGAVDGVYPPCHWQMGDKEKKLLRNIMDRIQQ